MGSVGALNKSIIKYVNLPQLTFGTAMVRDEYIDIDGYSNKKTIKGALNELAKAVDVFSVDEGDALRNMVKDNEFQQTTFDESLGGMQYILQYESVPSASQMNEDTNEMEYKDGRWYLHTRILR